MIVLLVRRLGQVFAKSFVLCDGEEAAQLHYCLDRAGSPRLVRAHEIDAAQTNSPRTTRMMRFGHIADPQHSFIHSGHNHYSNHDRHTVNCVVGAVGVVGVVECARLFCVLDCVCVQLCNRPSTPLGAQAFIHCRHHALSTSLFSFFSVLCSEPNRMRSSSWWARRTGDAYPLSCNCVCTQN